MHKDSIVCPYLSLQENRALGRNNVSTGCINMQDMCLTHPECHCAAVYIRAGPLQATCTCISLLVHVPILLECTHCSTRSLVRKIRVFIDVCISPASISLS